ncbi:hypothetical protein [Sinorhizobium meliloti]|uniref:hypothetical protein n=1 Tax=Rhizobium meliloti TaxID=382 RepID=UPI000FE068CA|nr:hypothetical protein [Sinorhizobium meliloti]RVO95008.1 hypothetical protein CN089_12545 [Sinorhizobium meliloti]
MADPTKYTPAYSYSGWQATNPSRPLPADEVDNDFANASLSVNQTIDALKDVRRSDGKLKNQSVGPDQISPALNIGFTMTGMWVDGRSYGAGDGVVKDDTFYSARVAHTADVSNAPGNDAYWNELFSLADIVVTGGMALPRDSFVGDGVTKDFTLSFTPLSKFNLFVQVGGVIQGTDAYSSNGNTLTFISPPPNGYGIEVRGFATVSALVTPEDGSVTTAKLADQAVTEAKLATNIAALLNGAMQVAVYDPDNKAANAFDSVNLDFLQTGTGAAVRSVQDRLRDRLHSKDVEGVVGNGVAIDTVGVKAAVQNALLTGRRLYWPDGKYRIDDNIPNFHDVRHEGPGTIVRQGLGEEIVANGGFGSAAGWTLSGGATISGGTLNFPGAGSAFATQIIAAIKPLTTYEVTYTIVSMSAGNVTFRLEGGTDVLGTNRAAPGTYTERLTSNATTTGVQFASSATFNGVIDNMSVREVRDDEWHITPTSSSVTNRLYAAAVGGSSANDGLTAAFPLDSGQRAVDRLVAWAPLIRGKYEAKLAEGTYARIRLPDDGLLTANYIRVAGAGVSITVGNRVALRTASRTGTFVVGETITFVGGATVLVDRIDNNTVWGTVTAGVPAYNVAMTGGTSGATATCDYVTPVPKTVIKEGATQIAFGILATRTMLEVENILVEDYNGNTTSSGIRMNFGFLKTINVHYEDCVYGPTVMTHSFLDVKGGLFNDCGYVASDPGQPDGHAIRSVFLNKLEIGTQGAGDRSQGPVIANCAGAFRAQEFADGHWDWVTTEDCAAGLRLLVNSRLNIGGSSFKRITGSAIYGTQGCHVDPDANTVFGTGVDKNGRNWSGGFGSTASGLGILSHNVGNAANVAILDDLFPTTAVTAPGVNTVVQSKTILVAALNDTKFSQIATKKVRFKAEAVLAGIGGVKRFLIRLNSSGTHVLAANFSAGTVGAVTVEGTVWLKGENSQYMTLKGQSSAAATIQGVDCTEPTNASMEIKCEVQPLVAGDSIHVKVLEWEVVGF